MGPARRSSPPQTFQARSARSPLIFVTDAPGQLLVALGGVVELGRARDDVVEERPQHVVAEAIVVLRRQLGGQEDGFASLFLRGAAASDASILCSRGRVSCDEPPDSYEEPAAP